MNFYPPKVSERFNRPENAGFFEAPSSTGAAASFSCGSFIQISLLIGASDKCIQDAKFRTNGCGYMVAAADVVAERLAGKRLTGLHGVDKQEIDRWLANALEEFPAGKKQCREPVIDALKNALANHRLNTIEEFRGEQALICTCFGITEERVMAVINENQTRDASEVADICNAGSGCGSCQMMIQELIDMNDREAQ